MVTHKILYVLATPSYNFTFSTKAYSCGDVANYDCNSFSNKINSALDRDFLINTRGLVLAFQVLLATMTFMKMLTFL